MLVQFCLEKSGGAIRSRWPTGDKLSPVQLLNPIKLVGASQPNPTQANHLAAIQLDREASCLQSCKTTWTALLSSRALIVSFTVSVSLSGREDLDGKNSLASFCLAWTGSACIMHILTLPIMFVQYYGDVSSQPPFYI